MSSSRWHHHKEVAQWFICSILVSGKWNLDWQRKLHWDASRFHQREAKHQPARFVQCFCATAKALVLNAQHSPATQHFCFEPGISTSRFYPCSKFYSGTTQVTRSAPLCYDAPLTLSWRSSDSNNVTLTLIWLSADAQPTDNATLTLIWGSSDAHLKLIWRSSDSQLADNATLTLTSTEPKPDLAFSPSPRT